MYYEKSYENCMKIVGLNPFAAKTEAIKYKRNKSILNVGHEQTFRTIQSAIDAANASDIISVDEGIYLENIVIKKPVLLVGKNKKNVIIDGKGAGSVISIENPGIIVSGFTIRNSGGNETQDVGIKIHSTSGGTIINNNIMNNGVGISISFSDGNRILYNDINSNHNFGVFIRSSQDNKIYSNNIQNNVFGISLNGGGRKTVIHSNNFIDNKEQAYDDGDGFNNWNDQIGNYWSDFNFSIDRYIIPGGHYKNLYPKDNHPLSNAIIIEFVPIDFSEPTRDNICILNKEVREAEKKDVLGIGRYG